MMWWIVLLGVAVVLVPLALWYREDAAQRALQAARARELALKHEQNQKLKEIVFRKQGESGLGGAAFGDIMCADGVYLPLLWESGFATSIDGRWLRISGYGHASPYLVDRKKRCTWTLSAEEVSVLEGMHWRLPRWSGEETSSGSMHDDGQGPWSDTHFNAWLAANVANQAMPMVELRDLWVPWDAVPVQKEEAPPELPLPPAGGIMVGVQRYWPQSLRTERQPLLLFTQPQWQLLFNGEPQPWVVAVDMPRLAPALLQRLHAVHRGGCTALAGHPLPMLLDIDADCRALLAAMLADPHGPRSLHALQQRLATRRLPLAPGDEACLFNCNTPVQWQEAAS